MKEILDHVINGGSAKYFSKAYQKDLVTINDVNNYINRTNANEYELAIIRNHSRIKTPIKKYGWRNSWNNKMLQQYWNDGCGFVLHTIHLNDELKNLIKFLEEYSGMQFDSHIYCGKKESTSYEYHCDVSHNLIIQCQGSTRWRVYPLITKQSMTFSEMKLDPVIDVIMNPGDVIWIPMFQVHYAEPITDRLSVSLPFSLPCKEKTTIQSPVNFTLNTQRHWRNIDDR